MKKRGTLRLTLCAAALALAGCAAGGGEGLSAPESEASAAPSAAQPPAESFVEPEEEDAAPPPFLLAAYLPASTPAAALGEYLPGFEQLGRVTVITGLCWDENGEVAVLDDNLDPLIERLLQLREEYRFELCATVYPANAIVRAGTAGKTVDTPDKRAALAANLFQAMRDLRLDGLDFDWETPENSEQWEAYGELAVALRELCLPLNTGRSITMALYPGDLDRLPGEAVGALTSVNVMAYDQFDENGYHATLDTMKSAVESAVAAGFAPRQIVAGIPAYGRPLDGAASWPLYRDAGLTEDQDLLGDVYYNSAALAREKAKWAREQGIGGVFLFHLAGDLPAGDSLSLLGAMAGTGETA